MRRGCVPAGDESRRVGGLTEAQHSESLELFQSDIAPVLRREIPDPPWPWGPVGLDGLGIEPAAEPSAIGLTGTG